MTSINELVSKFVFNKLLKSDSQTKSVVFLGEIDGVHAIVMIEKSHFVIDEDHFKIKSLIDEVLTINSNDIYYWSNATLFQDLQNCPGCKLNLIYPATETHIRKYSTQRHHYVLETPEMYQELVVPYIESMKGDRIKWVYNILFHGQESETFIYHDKDPNTGFVLLPDMKWDKINMACLYLTCIVNRTDISSIRDLDTSHLDWLVNLQCTIRKITSSKFQIRSDQLRIFVHYHPSYYHFHIHVVNVQHPGLGDGIAAGKAILLDEVIENIKLVGGYKNRSLGYIIGEHHGLWDIIKNKGDSKLLQS
jgi:m7GpppX diphosphatase